MSALATDRRGGASVVWSDSWEHWWSRDQRLKNYQYSTERQKRNQNLAPVLVIISWNSGISRKVLPVLVITGAALPTRQHQ